MAGEVFNHLVRFISVGIKNSGKRTGTYSGDNVRFDIMLQQSLHHPQMRKSFNKSSA